MDIIGMAFIVLGSSMLFPLAVAGMLKWVCTVRHTSIHVDVRPLPIIPLAEYPPEIWLSIHERSQVAMLRYLVRAGRISEDLPDEQVAE